MTQVAWLAGHPTPPRLTGAEPYRLSKQEP